MRSLLLSSDPRFIRDLQQRGPDAVAFVAVADAAGAIRAWDHGDFDAAVVDTGTPPAVTAEFLRWWGASPARSFRPLVLTGHVSGPLPESAQVTERSAAAVARAFDHSPAIDAQRALYLDTESRQLVATAGVIALTPSESSLLRYLVEAARAVPATELLQQALGYRADDSVALVRTHVRNIRRKAAAAGLSNPLTTARGRGYAAPHVVLRHRLAVVASLPN